MFAKIFRDPLVAFLLLSVLIFIADGVFSSSTDEFNIAVRTADVQRLHDQWSMQMRRPPSDQELAGLLEQFVKEEIYYREALRRDLQNNDTIVRRRLVQKLTFLTEDIATAIAPTEDEISAYFEEHKEDYRIPHRASFRHRYFSSDRRERAQQDATAAVGDESAAGDPFMLQREYASRSEREIGDLFGRAFAQALFELAPTESWQGPIQSAYGWHAVDLSAKQDSRIPALDEIKERVIADAKQATRREANTAYYEDLKAQYQVSYPPELNSTPQTP